jgi:hypothetical protein
MSRREDEREEADSIPCQSVNMKIIANDILESLPERN